MPLTTIRDAYARFQEFFPESARTRDDFWDEMHRLGYGRYEDLGDEFWAVVAVRPAGFGDDCPAS